MRLFHRWFAVAIVAVALAASAPSARAAEHFVVDPVHSCVIFKIEHAGISWIYGRFDHVAGEFSIDKQDPSGSSFVVNIKAESVDTNNPKRNDHLRGPDFFNVKQFPVLSFKSTSVKAVDGGYEVTGDFTMHGVTKPISFVLHGGKEASFPPGTRRIGFSTELTLKRSDYGMDKFSGMLGEDVHAEVALEAVMRK